MGDVWINVDSKVFTASSIILRQCPRREKAEESLSQRAESDRADLTCSKEFSQVKLWREEEKRSSSDSPESAIVSEVWGTALRGEEKCLHTSLCVCVGSVLLRPAKPNGSCSAAAAQSHVVPPPKEGTLQ